MTLPPPFQKFTSYFHQDIDTVYESPEELVHEALYDFTPQDRQALKEYMAELLSGKFDEMQLREIWDRSRAEVSPFRGDEGDCTGFLKYFQRLIEADMPQPRD
jgi:hypothetical protein